MAPSRKSDSPFIHSVIDDGSTGDMIDYSKVVSQTSGSTRDKVKSSASSSKSKSRAKKPAASDSDATAERPKSKRRNSTASGKSGKSGKAAAVVASDSDEPVEKPKSRRRNSTSSAKSGKSTKSNRSSRDKTAAGVAAGAGAAVLAPVVAALVTHDDHSDADTEHAGERTPTKRRSRSRAASTVSQRKPSTSSEDDSDAAPRRKSSVAAAKSSGTEGRGEKPPKRSSRPAKRNGIILNKKPSNGNESASIMSGSEISGRAISVSTRASEPDTLFESSAGEESDDDRELYAPVQNKATRPKAASVRSGRSGRSTGSRSSSKAPSVRKHADSDEERKSLRAANGDAGPIRRKGSLKLTPHDRHYTAKALTYLQMQREWSALGQIGELAMFGEPFLPHPTGPLSKPGGKAAAAGGLFGFGKKKDAESKGEVPEWEKPLQPIILDYEFFRFILQFPGLNEAPLKFWQERIQPFFDSFAERGFSTTRERSEITKRRLLSLAFTRILGTYTSTCVTALGDSSPLRPDASLMKRVDSLFPGTQENMFRLLFRSKAAQAKRDGKPGYASWVAIVESYEGRDGGEDYTILTTVLAQKDRPLYAVVRSWKAFESFADKLDRIAERHGDLGLPALPPEVENDGPPDRLTLQRYLRLVVLGLSNPPSKLDDQQGLSKARVQLERFLLDKPEKLSNRDRRDLLKTAERDDRKLERERRLWIKAGARIRYLRTTWCQYRDALIAGEELQQSFALLKKHPKVNDLPTMHRDAEEWARIWVAYNLHFIFVSSPNAPEIVNLLKSFHELIPYGLFKTALRIINPTFMIKSVVNIVFGQPMGSQSLFARVFSIIMNRDIKAREKDIEKLKSELGDDSLADCMRKHVYASRGHQEDVRRASYENAEDMVVAILVEGGVPEKRVREIERGREAYLSAGGTVDLTVRPQKAGSAAADFYRLKQILRAYCLKRDREQVLEIALEPNTPTLIKSFISVYYNGIYQIANACNLADRLGDLQAFFDDVITTVESGKHSTGDFIQLAARHEQSIYALFHEMHAYGGDLTKPIIRWCRSGLEYIRKGVPSTTKAGGGKGRRLGVDIDRLMDGVDDKTREAILHESRGLAAHTRLRKIYNDIWMRCDMLYVQHKIKLSPNDIYAQLAVDPDVAAYRKKFGRTDRVRPEDAVSWAWWAEEDILDDVNEEPDNWRKAAERADKLAKETHTADLSTKPMSGRRKPLRRSESAASLGEVDQSAASVSLIPMPPRLLATKTLLAPFCDRIVDSLKAARENEIV